MFLQNDDCFDEDVEYKNPLNSHRSSALPKVAELATTQTSVCFA